MQGIIECTGGPGRHLETPGGFKGALEHIVEPYEFSRGGLEHNEGDWKTSRGH